MDFSSLLPDMLNAAKAPLAKEWTKAQPYAEQQLESFIQSIERIVLLKQDGSISEEQAKLLISMHKRSMITVLLTVKGLGLLAIESAINAALGVVSYFTPGGQLKWTRETPSSNRNGQSDVLNHVLVYDANTIIVVGSGAQLTGKRNLIAAQLDSNGITKWTLNLDMGNNEHHGWGVARVGAE